VEAQQALGFGQEEAAQNAQPFRHVDLLCLLVVNPHRPVHAVVPGAKRHQPCQLPVEGLAVPGAAGGHGFGRQIVFEFVRVLVLVHDLGEPDFHGQLGARHARGTEHHHLAHPLGGIDGGLEHHPPADTGAGEVRAFHLQSIEDIAQPGGVVAVQEGGRIGVTAARLANHVQGVDPEVLRKRGDLPVPEGRAAGDARQQQQRLAILGACYQHVGVSEAGPDELRLEVALDEL
jgi:hypothetical protein